VDPEEDVVARRARGSDAPRGGRPGDRLVTWGAVAFTVGLLATLVTMVPFFVGSDPFPTPVYLVALLAPGGLALALTGLLRAARSHRDPSQ
jgi:hypothetical protein